MYENSTLYSHFCSFSPANVTVSIGSYLILVLQPLLLHEQEKHVTMIFSVGDLQVFLQKLLQLPLVADTILLGMRALGLIQ